MNSFHICVNLIQPAINIKYHLKLLSFVLACAFVLGLPTRSSCAQLNVGSEPLRHARSSVRCNVCLSWVAESVLL